MSGSESVVTIKDKVSLEELAKNRGDAMLRYKEKKKTRRYIIFRLTVTHMEQVQMNIYKNPFMQPFGFVTCPLFYFILETSHFIFI